MKTPAERERRLALGLLILCGVFWSSAGVLIKYVAWNPMAIWSVRSAIAGATLWAIFRPSFRNLIAAEWAAAISLALTTGLFIAANKYTTAANAILIQYAAPVWVALAGTWFLGETASRRDWIVIVLVLLGITTFFFDELNVHTTVGNIIALVASVTFAINTMCLRKIAQHGPMRSVILGNGFAAVVGAPALLWATSLPPSGWLALVGLGVVQQACAYLCLIWSIKRVTALEGMLLPIVEPLLSPVWVWLVFGETLGRFALIGGLIVISAVTWRALPSRSFGKPLPS